VRRREPRHRVLREQVQQPRHHLALLRLAPRPPSAIPGSSNAAVTPCVESSIVCPRSTAQTERHGSTTPVSSMLRPEATLSFAEGIWRWCKRNISFSRFNFLFNVFVYYVLHLSCLFVQLSPLCSYFLLFSTTEHHGQRTIAHIAREQAGPAHRAPRCVPARRRVHVARRAPRHPAPPLPPPTR
jgi:hypothetical protein